VAINSGFFDTLPKLKRVARNKAEIAWLVYDLIYNTSSSTYELTHKETVYTGFDAALSTLTKSEPGDVNDFVTILQGKLDEKLEENNPPDAPTLDQIVGGHQA
jgi:Restriction endonuclease NotI